MKVISIVNLKGGVGKTVTAVNMAAILASRHNQRVLLIDADHQHNATSFYGFGGADEDYTTLSDVLCGLCDYYPDAVQPTRIPHLDILPSSMALLTLDLESLARGNVTSKVLADLRDAMIEDDAYDYIIIDCPPAFSAASVAAIAASTDIIIPVKAGKFELDGLAELIAQITSVQRLNHGVRITGVLMTMWHRAEVVLQGEAYLRQHAGVPVFRTVIRRTDKVDESTYAAEPICDYSRGSAAAQDYRKFVDEFLKGGVSDG